MKKLGKKINTSAESIEAYCQVVCSCSCPSCDYSFDGIDKLTIQNSNKSAGGTYSHW